MKKILLFLLVGLLASCSTSHFEDLNTDKKNASVIPGEPLFTNASRNAFDLMSEANVNRNVYRLYAQYWAQCTYPEESQYNMVTRNIPDNIFSAMYKDVLRDYKEAKAIIGAEETNSVTAPIQANKLAIIGIMEAWVYGILVDNFGDIPYTDALDGSNLSPTYDDDQEVYNSVIASLQAAVSSLDAGSSAFSGSQDPIYFGDVAGWKKFGHSLLMRFGMRLADADAGKAKSLVEGNAANAFASNDEGFAMHYFSSTPNTNTLWVDLIQSGRKDFVPSNTIIDNMNANNDPRRALWFDINGDVYKGGDYGYANSYVENSNIGGPFVLPESTSTMLNYAEVAFMLAEASERGFSVGGDAETHYNAGVTASIMEWGGSQADADAYLAEAGVAYGSAAGDWKQKIGTQKWLSQFNNGFEGWSVYRALDFEGFNAADGLSVDDVPTRMIYPVNEATLNNANWSAAGAKFGGDSKTAKIFWDVN